MDRRKILLYHDLIALEKIRNNLLREKELRLSDLEVTESIFSKSRYLLREKVISELDMLNETSRRIAKDLTIPNIDNAILQTELAKNEKIVAIAGIRNDSIVQRQQLLQATQSTIADISEWEKENLLVAPISGRITYAKFYFPQRQVLSNETVFFVEPRNPSYFAETTIPQYNSGGIRVGQKVLLKFDAYPFQQYGLVEGVLKYMSDKPSDSGFRAHVELPNGLVTTSNIQIGYKNGLVAKTEIISQNRSLLSRFSSSVIDLINER